MIAQGVEIGVVLNPRFGLVVGVWQQMFEQIECGLSVAERCVGTGYIVLGQKVIGVDSNAPGQPFLCPVVLTKGDEGFCTEIGRP